MSEQLAAAILYGLIVVFSVANAVIATVIQGGMIG